MSLSKGEWVVIKDDLSFMYRPVYLKCDDFLIAVKIVREKMKLFVFVYVNGYVKGTDSWFGYESDLATMGDIARRFYCLRSTGPSKKSAALSLKAFGKKVCKERGYLDRSYSAYPIFATPGAFIAHIKKHNPSIELLDYEVYVQLRAAQPEEVINATE